MTARRLAYAAGEGDSMSERHPAVQALAEAIGDLSDSAPDLTMADAGTLSSLQVQLGEIVLQVVRVARLRQGEHE